MRSDMISVAIVDNHPVVLSGMERMLSNRPNLKLTDCYPDGDSLLRGLRQAQPDVLLLDIQLPGPLKGEDLAYILARDYPGVRMLALTNIDQPFTVRAMFAAGVKGYLLKDADPYMLAEAIERVYEGGRYLDGSLQDIIGTAGMSDDNILLTQREQAVLEMIAEELTTTEIAARLFISAKRIENCRTNLFLKLDVKNAAGLIRKAIQLGLIR